MATQQESTTSEVVSKLQSPNIELRPMTTLEDHKALVAIRKRAIQVDYLELDQIAFGGQDVHEEQNGTHIRAERSLKNSQLPGHQWIGAYDRQSGKLVGGAHWYFYHDPTAPFSPWGAGGGPTPGTNVALVDAHFGPMDEARERFMKGKKYVYMCLLMVDPDMQRSGIGSMLLRHTLKEVDELGYEAWIEASLAGVGLYKKLGWEVVFTIKTDLKEWGGQRIQEDVAMLRQSRPSNTTNSKTIPDTNQSEQV